MKKLRTKLCHLILLMMSVAFNACNGEGIAILVKEDTGLKKWGNGKIPYMLHPDVTWEQRDKLWAAMDVWESNTPVEFIQKKYKKGSTFIVMIRNSWRNYSSTGKRKNSFLELKSYALGVLLHELGHSIGLRHEHQRPDRGNYVAVYWEHIKPENVENYVIVFASLIDMCAFDYDWKSIMHYGESLALVPHAGYKIVSSPEISEIDMQKVNTIY